MTTTNNDEKYREEFKSRFNPFDYPEDLIHIKMREAYLAACKECEEEIEELKAEVEKWKKEAHKRLNELVNDHWFKKYKELERLNNSLKRESSFLKDENYMLSLDGNLGIKLPESFNLNKELQLRNDLLKEAVPWVTWMSEGGLEEYALIRREWCKRVSEVLK